MPGDLVRRLSTTPAERAYDQALDRVHAQTDLAHARVRGIAQVSQTAMLGTLSLALLKREAGMLVPEDAGKFDLIATQAAIAMAGEINRLAGQ